MSGLRDVVVIGGGPAGSTAGAILAQHGRDALVLERDTFPREHVGESLLPYCFPLFDRLGVREVMEALFVRKPTVRFVTHDGSRYTNWCFNHVIHDPSYLSFQVDRKVFDHVLLTNAARLGADVRTRTKVTDVRIEADRVVVTAAGPEGEQVHEARYLVDCSGRASFLASRNGWRTTDRPYDRTALWTHFDGVTMTGGLEEGASLIVYLGGDKRGWIWVFPLGPDRITVGVVLETAYLRDRKRELAAEGVEGWAEALFAAEIGLSPFVSAMVEGAAQVMPVRAEGDYTYDSSVKRGPRFQLVGDAGRFIDPIFSSGVFLSAKSAWLVADALHQMLPSLDDDAPMVEARAKIDGAYSFVFRLIESFYHPRAISWAGARTFVAEHREHEAAMDAGRSILAGDFFENHAKYHAFLDLLQDPHYYDLYRESITERPTVNVPSCELPAEDAARLFPAQTPTPEVADALLRARGWLK